MKNKFNFLKNVFGLLSLSIITISCTDNDQPYPTVICPNTDILGLEFDPNFYLNSAAATPLFGYLDNSAPLSTLVSINNLSITSPTSPSYLQMSSANNAAYNATTGDYKLVIAEESRLITINSVGSLTHTAIPILNTEIVNAPVYLNGNLYFGKSAYSLGNLVFNVVDDSFNSVNTITIPSSDISGNYTANFTSATNGVDELYFAIGNNIIIYNTTLNTISASMITGAVIPSGTIIGLEFKEDNKLYALHEDWMVANTKLVEIDITNSGLITSSDIIDLGFEVNYEFFSTTYNECNQKFYLSTINLSSSPTNLRIDLNGTPTIVTLNSGLGWVAGLCLKK